MARCTFKAPFPGTGKPGRCPTETHFRCPICDRVACHDHRDRVARSGRVVCLACYKKSRPRTQSQQQGRAYKVSPASLPQATLLPAAPRPRYYRPIPHAVASEPRESRQPSPVVTLDLNSGRAHPHRRPNWVQRLYYRKQGWLASGHGHCHRCGTGPGALYRRWHFVIPVYVCQSCFQAGKQPAAARKRRKRRKRK